MRAAPALRPVTRRSLADGVFDQLLGEIVGGRLAAGDPLPAERVLVDAFGVNRGAVREALKRLEQMRLVAMHQGGATRVRDYRREAGLELLPALLARGDGSLDTDVVRGLVELRTALGTDAARLAARRSGGELAVALGGVLAAMRERRADLVALQDLAMEFWDRVVDGSRNVAYRLAMNSLRQSYDAFREVLRPLLAEELRDLRGYERLAEAIAAGDPRGAERAASQLVARGARRLTAALAELEGAAP